MRTPRLVAVLLALPLATACVATEDADRYRHDLEAPDDILENVHVDPVPAVGHAPADEPVGLPVALPAAPGPRDVAHLPPLGTEPDTLARPARGAHATLPWAGPDELALEQTWTHVDPVHPDLAVWLDQPALDAFALGQRARLRFDRKERLRLYGALK